MSNKSNQGKAATPDIKAAVENAETKAKQKRQDASNEATAGKRITEKKDLKYIYPEDCDTIGDRKKFRTTCRGKIRTMLKGLEKLKDGNATSEEIRKATKEYNRFIKSVHVAPEVLELAD